MTTDPSTTEAPSATGQSSAAPEGGLVVLVEDDVQIRRFLRVTLPHHGFRLVEAGTAADGLRNRGFENAW